MHGHVMPIMRTMTLDEYAKQKSMTDEQLGALIGKDRSLVSKYRRGEVTPSLDVIATIEDVTNGKVRFRDWLGEAAPARKVS
jgi:transcriptional regulator with XRE-family HTH domain